MRRLLIRPGAIGDCILCFPALTHLRAEYTEVWISSPVVPLVKFAERVRPIASTSLDLLGLEDVEMPLGLVESLRGFDSIVSWYGMSRPPFREALLSLNSACEFHPALPAKHFRGHATAFFLEQVGAAPGLAAQIDIQPSTPRGTVVIHPFSGGPRKNWPLASYFELATRLPLQTEWTCGPEEHLPDATRFSNLSDLANWIAGARLYIGNDSGITHLAAAAGVTTIAIFGPTSPGTWAPRGENVTVLYSNPLEALPVGDVLGAANRLLGSQWDAASSEQPACGPR